MWGWPGFIIWEEEYGGYGAFVFSVSVSLLAVFVGVAPEQLVLPLGKTR